MCDIQSAVPIFLAACSRCDLQVPATLSLLEKAEVSPTFWKEIASE